MSSTRGWPLVQQFMVKVKQGDNGCIIWTGGSDGRYGMFNRQMAHRAAYELFVGAIPEGLDLDHLCREKLCVNPAHLEPVTHRENILRSNGVTAQNARKERCIRGHLLEGDNARVNNEGRRCRECNRARGYWRRRMRSKYGSTWRTRVQPHEQFDAWINSHGWPLPVTPCDGRAVPTRRAANFAERNAGHGSLRTAEVRPPAASAEPAYSKSPTWSPAKHTRWELNRKAA